VICVHGLHVGICATCTKVYEFWRQNTHVDQARVEQEIDGAIDALAAACPTPNEWLSQEEKEIADLERLYRL
jgi:hypothetical protein